MIEWWGPVIHEYYAGTEGNGFVYCNSEEWLAHKGTVGQALLGAVHICRRGRRGAARRRGGHDLLRGRRELRVPQRPREDGGVPPPEQGWSTLGDVGYVDEDGFLYLTDRKAYMIISGGVNIYPQEAENVLAMHPKVADVAVFGVPDEDFGEEVKAVVAAGRRWPTPGPSWPPSSSPTAASTSPTSSARASVDFRDELPRHPTGKLYKRLLKDEYWKAAGRSI